MDTTRTEAPVNLAVTRARLFYLVQNKENLQAFIRLQDRLYRPDPK